MGCNSLSDGKAALSVVGQAGSPIALSGACVYQYVNKIPANKVSVKILHI